MSLGTWAAFIKNLGCAGCMGSPKWMQYELPILQTPCLSETTPRLRHTGAGGRWVEGAEEEEEASLTSRDCGRDAGASMVAGRG